MELIEILYTILAGTALVTAILQYKEYKQNTIYQKALLSPILELSMQKFSGYGEPDINSYQITIHNYGNQIARKVKLQTYFASEEDTLEPSTWETLDFRTPQLSGGAIIDTGDIAPKDKKIVPLKHTGFNSNKEFRKVYGVILKATCEDLLGERKKLYSAELKKYFDAIDEYYP